MSKRLIVVIATAVVLLVLGINTSREQADLIRFDRAMLPILDAMEKTADQAAKSADGVASFHEQLPVWKGQIKAITPPAKGYRADLHKAVTGFFGEFEAYIAKEPAKSRETKTFEQVAPSMTEFKKQLKHGPEGGGDDDDGHGH